MPLPCFYISRPNAATGTFYPDFKSIGGCIGTEMAQRTPVLTILVVMLVVSAGLVVEGEQLCGSNHQEEEPPVPVAGGAFPKSECGETRLYGGPCLEAFCAAACLLRMHRQGGHCKGGFFDGGCHCFACS